MTPPAHPQFKPRGDPIQVLVFEHGSLCVLLRSGLSATHFLSDLLSAPGSAFDDSGIRSRIAMSVTLHTTHGDIKVEIFCEAVPKAAENFLALCASGYYYNTLWHRNIKGFMVQTGDPTGSGKGGQSIWGKPFSDEVRSTLKFNNRGILAMANSGADTNKSQFFITYAKQPHLDGKYTIFGKVIDGADSTLEAMERVPVNAKNRPLNEIRTTHVTIHANPIADAQLVGR